MDKQKNDTIPVSALSVSGSEGMISAIWHPFVSSAKIAINLEIRLKRSMFFNSRDKPMK